MSDKAESALRLAIILVSALVSLSSVDGCAAKTPQENAGKRSQGNIPMATHKQRAQANAVAAMMAWTKAKCTPHNGGPSLTYIDARDVYLVTCKDGAAFESKVLVAQDGSDTVTVVEPNKNSFPFPGDVVSAKNGLPCIDSTASFDALLKAMANNDTVRRDRIFVQHGVMLEKGEHVRGIDLSGVYTQVRRSDGSACWVHPAPGDF